MTKPDVTHHPQTSGYSHKINDPFWSHYIELVRNVVVPYQWEALNDRIEGAEPSRAIRNFRIAAGDEEGVHYGMVFQDSDVAKWIEAASYLLSAKHDPELEVLVDSVIETIARAQQADGYLNTYFTLREPGARWTNLAECHELYCAGHMIEAGVAYYHATGKRTLLDVVIRLADHIGTVFGTEPGQLPGYDGHQEIELALFKLYETTKGEKYLELSRYFLDQRGASPHFFVEEWEQRGRTIHFGELDMVHRHTYSQSHLPIREQSTAEGHSVRLVYMCAAMADVAAKTEDTSLKEACERLWSNIVSKRMYITGSIGSSAKEEAFTGDYDLPGDTAYAETCASIGLIFWAKRMLQMEQDSRYADVMERALYNTVISGMSLDGQRFFYVNPLEVDPKMQRVNPNYAHVRTRRQGWFGCACCPPNIARLIASLDQYVYTPAVEQATLYVQLYIGGEGEFTLEGRRAALTMDSDYTSTGDVKLIVRPDSPEGMQFTIALRKPDWCKIPELWINGEKSEQDGFTFEYGYIKVNRSWKAGDEIKLHFPKELLRMKGHDHIKTTFGKVAIQRGPFMYCLEEVDNGRGLHRIQLPRDAEFHIGSGEQMPLGVPDLTTIGQRIVSQEDWGIHLYRSDVHWDTQPAELQFIPYFTWANRDEGEMSVWIRESE
ncbi:glycoside hydrolase family 127 protein [Paenibacillus xylanexedens]|uniref:glycoside hydrolase family 127 protein n=1 Tax=Paenibacillus xylanexedens TaxID=528191 RepID=UPI001F2C2EC9|nr:beta-L-arabinofuranosidase domain-containing protein [Paenibacillus xylanexedens]MCF7754073.1 glycoside hydrolase family 127 protein [Paenibacillus xylanexedens]